MDLAALYSDFLRDIGLSATYCGLYDEAEVIYKVGLKIDYSSRKPIEALMQNEIMKENYSFALSEVEKWELNHELTPVLIVWKGIALYFLGRAAEAQGAVYELRRQENHELADHLNTVLDALEAS